MHTGYEIVRRTIEFDNPGRIALALRAPYPSDMVGAGIENGADSPATDWRQVASGDWEMVDEWGNLWRRLEDHSKGEVAAGALEDWARLDTLPFPDYDVPARYETARGVFAANPDLWKIGSIPGFPFNIARKMRRLDRFLVDIILERDRVVELLNRVEEQMHHAIRRLADAGADAIMVCEDWGTQDRLLVSLPMWREFFLPGYRRLCGAAHERGVKVMLHSCGKISEAMEDMVEAGIDVFQFDQPALHGIGWLSENFSRPHKASFWCPVDIQRTLQTRDREVIEREVQRMVEQLGGFGGGFIAGVYGDDRSIGLEPWVQDFASQAFLRYGVPPGTHPSA